MQLQIELQTQDEKVHFGAVARENAEIAIDYFPPVGTGQGYTSLELLLVSFTSCLGTTVLTLLRHRMKKEVTDMQLKASGQMKEAHPKSLASIDVQMSVTAKDTSEEEVQQAITTAEAICPVWDMIKGNTVVNVEATVKAE